MPHQRFMASPLTSTQVAKLRWAVFTQPLTTTCVDRQGLSNAGRTKRMIFSIF